MAVVDRRVRGDHRAAAVEDAVADRDLHRPGADPGAVLADPGREASGARQHPERCQGIAGAAPAPLQLRRELARQLGAEADRGDVEERRGR